MKIAVGSKNPVKINATKEAFKKVWPKRKWEVVGVSVPSGVSDQPMSDKESIKGATNRAKRSLRVGNANYGVGIEGGMQKIGSKWFDSTWVVVVDKKVRVGIGSTVGLETPSKMMKLIKSGMELGDVNDKLFGLKNSKQAGGHFGIMTKNVITRKSGYVDGIIMALTRFIHPKLWG